MDIAQIFSNWGGENNTNPKPGKVDAIPKPGNTGGNNGDNKSDTNNVVDGDDSLVNDVWNNTPASDKGGENKDNPGGKQPLPGNTQVDPQKMIADHLKEVGLEPVQLTDEDKQAIKDGTFNLEGYIQTVNSKFANGYINIMKNVNTLVKNEVAEGLKQANQNTTNILEGVNLKNFLEAGIPYIKDDGLLGPVAETAFQKFYAHPDVKKDKTRALELTKKFLTRTADTVNKNNPEYNLNRGSFRGSPSDNGGDVDWLKAIRGQK